MTQLVDRVDKLIASNQANVTQGIANIKDVTGKLETTADNVNQITGKIKEGEGTVGKLVQSEETHKNLNEALVAVKEGVAGLNKALGTRRQDQDRPRVSVGDPAPLSKGKGYFTLDIDPPTYAALLPGRAGEPAVRAPDQRPRPSRARRSPTATRKSRPPTRRNSKTISRSRRSSDTGGKT